MSFELHAGLDVFVDDVGDPVGECPNPQTDEGRGETEVHGK